MKPFKLVVAALQISAAVAATQIVSGCGAVYSWDTMQLQSVKKQAAQKLMVDCNAGDKDACRYVAGDALRYGY